MSRREWIFAALLAVSGAAITTGAWLAYQPAGWVVGGVVLAAWAWLVLGEVAE